MKLCICGIGNEFRRDDSVPLRLMDELEKENLKDVLILRCETVPESFLGKIQKFSPEKIIIVDAVDFNEKPGIVKKVNIEKIIGETTSTHNLPLTMFIRYLKENLDSELIFLGFQPKSVEFGEKISREGKNALEKLKRKIVGLAKK